MKIEVFGTGCKNCERLFENARCAADQFQSRTKIIVEKVSDPRRFLKKGVFVTPALVINGEMTAAGRIPDVREICQTIEERMQL